jgi:hypothetical protein
MITGKLNIGVRVHKTGSWMEDKTDRPNLFILEFMEDGNFLFMNNEAIKGISKYDLRTCLLEVIDILEEAE